MGKPTNNMDIFNWFNPNVLQDMLKTKGLNFVDFRFIKDFINTKIGMFGYEGLIDGLTDEIIESALCFNNKLCFIKDEILGLVLCRYIPNGDYNIYWKPKTVNLIALNGVDLGVRNYDDIVICRDNTMDIIPYITLIAYINKIQDIENTLFQNINLAKIPAFFTGDKKTVASFNKIIEKSFNHDSFAIVDSEISDALQQYDIHFAISPEELLEIMKNYMNLCMQSFGVYGIASQKRERLLSTEVQSQNDFVDMIYQDMKNNRIRFIKEIKEKFNIDIKLVESYKQYKEEEIELQKLITDNNEKGENDDNN